MKRKSREANVVPEPSPAQLLVQTPSARVSVEEATECSVIDEPAHVENPQLELYESTIQTEDPICVNNPPSIADYTAELDPLQDSELAGKKSKSRKRSIDCIKGHHTESFLKYTAELMECVSRITRQDAAGKKAPEEIRSMWLSCADMLICMASKKQPSHTSRKVFQ